MKPVTASEAAIQLGVDRTTVNTWARRGWVHDGQRRKLEVIDHDGPRNAARYDLDQAWVAERQTAANRKSRRWRNLDWAREQMATA